MQGKSGLKAIFKCQYLIMHLRLFLSARRKSFKNGWTGLRLVDFTFTPLREQVMGESPNQKRNGLEGLGRKQIN